MSAARDGFLSRWSRLKREGAPEPRRDAGAAAQPEPSPEGPELPDGKTLEDLLAELPRIEDLVPGQSLVAFMQPWVPAALRNAALQHMWLLDPVIRDYVDPALDYAYDYNAPGAAPGFGTMETTQEAVREVAAMFDRALGRDNAQAPPPECGDNAPQAVGNGPEVDAASQHGPPPEVAVTAAIAGVPTPAVQVPEPAAPQPFAADAASHNETGEARLLRRTRGRHGGALPG